MFNVLLILIVAIFYVAFEKLQTSRRSPGKIVLVAQICAICIVTRAIFSFVPYFNPVLAMIFLSGVALGAIDGFVIGSLTPLVSNFLFGQGPWTLYQMVSWGIVGLAAGVIVKCKILKKFDWTIKDYFVSCVCCLVMIMVVTGPLCDLSSLFFIGEFDLAKIKGVFLAGAIFNFLLALSSVLTILIFARSFLRILKRVENKIVFNL